MKTYLPDGDIDLAIFQNKGNSPQLRETWFTQLSAFLQRESFNQSAPYRVKDVQVIHAEVLSLLAVAALFGKDLSL